jgi:hypothetical protein
MLVIAVQFYSRDWWRAMKLLRLLADAEKRRRDDACLLLVRTTECPVTRYLDDMVSRCSEVFHVESLVLRPDTEARRARWDELDHWPVGCNVLWAGAAEYFLRDMGSQWSTIFFVDGGDGVPLHREWVDVFVEDHARTLRAGQSVTGAVFRDGLGRWHANGNVVVERSFLKSHPEVLAMPEGREAWDVHHAPSVLPGCRASSIVCCGWRQVGARAEYFPEASKHSAWWHGCKDGNFVDLARAHVLGEDRPRPEILDFGRAADLAAGASSC